MKDRSLLREAALDVELCRGDALQQVFKEKHVEGLGETGARDIGAGVRRNTWMDVEDLE
jgi:hypothetical protein